MTRIERRVQVRKINLRIERKYTPSEYLASRELSSYSLVRKELFPHYLSTHTAFKNRSSNKIADFDFM